MPIPNFYVSLNAFRVMQYPTTFQRCMLDILDDMLENTMEVFMDDFFVLGDSFNIRLWNLEPVLERCKETNLVHSW